MKAQAYRALGQKRLELVELPRPEPAPDEVLVRICCAGVNPVDWKAMEGLFRGRMPYHFPAVPGWDAAGVVAAVGADVAAWKAGDAVMTYGRGPVIGRNGSYAQFACFPADILAPKPPHLSWSEAAALPLAFLTAWQALVGVADVQRGQTVIIPAAAGGVGSIAVQVARHLGARVIATCRAQNRDYVRRLGADQVLDYRTELGDLPRQAGDCLLGSLPPAQLAAYLPAVKSGGVVIPLSGQGDLKEVEAVSIAPLFTAPSAQDLSHLVALVERGALKPPAVIEFGLEQADAALDLSRSGHNRGKIALKVAA